MKKLLIIIMGISLTGVSADYVLKQKIKEEIAANFKTEETQVYSFSSHTFTNCGKTGRLGPTLEQCRAAYNTNWDENSSYYEMNRQGYQLWTVPKTGLYTIELAGAKGGGIKGGNGAFYKGDFELIEGEKIQILVGQMGASHNGNSSGGGGGSFVVREDNTPLIIAGGGSGGINEGYGDGGVLSNNSSQGGNFGISQGGRIYKYDNLDISHGSGGAGFNGNGERGGVSSTALSFINGGSGATGYDSNGWGGFGGGGGYHNSGNNVAGGGGGYTGGRGNLGYNATKAGGGGSYNIGLNKTGTPNNNAGHGYVKITKL